jgi:L1 cell adhesion molecule like protein
VSFDVDANGILKVSAKELTTGIEQNITISNDGSRLSQDQIEEMIKDAEKYKEEDERQRQLLESKNNYENYIYQMKSTIEDEKVKEKLGSNYDEIKERLDKGEEVLQVVDVTKEEYEKAQQELEHFINPIMQKIVKEGGGETMHPEDDDTMRKDETNMNEEPNMEEID